MRLGCARVQYRVQLVKHATVECAKASRLTKISVYIYSLGIRDVSFSLPAGTGFARPPDIAFSAAELILHKLLSTASISSHASKIRTNLAGEEV